MTQEEMAKLHWEHVTRGVFQCRETGKFHWVDEVEQMDETPYDTVEAAQEALVRYCKEILG